MPVTRRRQHHQAFETRHDAPQSDQTISSGDEFCHLLDFDPPMFVTH
jgi:hypothetical protein